MRKLLLFTVIFSIFVIGGCKKNQDVPVNKYGVNITDIQTIDKAGYDKLKEENKDKIILFNFFGSWCPPCKAETPYFIDVYEKYKNDNFLIVGLSVDPNKEDAIEFVNRYGITYPVYIADISLQNDFKIRNIPTTLIVKDGMLVRSFPGQIPENLLIQMAKTGRKE